MNYVRLYERTLIVRLKVYQRHVLVNISKPCIKRIAIGVKLKRPSFCLDFKEFLYA